MPQEESCLEIILLPLQLTAKEVEEKKIRFDYSLRNLLTKQTKPV